MSNIKYVFLDLDDTVLDFKRSERTAISKTLSHFGFEPDNALVTRYSEINRAMWKMLERGETTRAQMRTERFRIFFSEIGCGASGEEAMSVYEGALKKTCFFIQNSQDVLEKLSKSYSLYLASNGTAAVQTSRIEVSGIAKYFDNIFISDLIGHNKPAREFFDYCFSQIMGFERDRAIIVGDSLSSDILGGINAGIRTCLFAPEERKNDSGIIPNYQIKSLNELPLLLESI